MTVGDILDDLGYKGMETVTVIGSEGVYLVPDDEVLPGEAIQVFIPLRGRHIVGKESGRSKT